MSKLNLTVLKNIYTSSYLSQVCKGGSIKIIHHTNRITNKNHRSTLISADKAFGKNPTAIHDKKFNKLVIEGGLPELHRNYLKNPSANITLNSDKLKAFPLRLDTK